MGLRSPNLPEGRASPRPLLRMKMLIKNGTMVGAQSAGTGTVDILIDGGVVEKVAPGIVAPGAEVVDAAGKLVVPGLVDVHVHFREPGQEYKEDIGSGSRAAASGGFTTVVAEPNTVPPIDTPARIRRVLEIARRKSVVNFYTKAAITVGLGGARLADIPMLKEAGARAISDDGHPVPGDALMFRAMVKAGECGIQVSPHCEESHLYRERMLARESVREAGQSQRRMPYGRPDGQPYTSEAGLIRRDIEMAEKANARIHISHVSLAESVEIIAAAKKRGVRVTAEAGPQHLLLTEEDARAIGPNAKVNPPLRTKDDVAAVRQGLGDGTIDIIASDHAPHSPEEKSRSWDEAPFGVIGLETTLGVILTHIVRPGVLTLAQAIEKMTIGPARIFGLDVDGVGSLAPGSAGDVTIIDPDLKWKVDANQFQSKGRNCPFNGWDLCGRAVLTIVRGKVVARETP